MPVTDELAKCRAELGDAVVKFTEAFAMLRRELVQSLMVQLTASGELEAAEALMRYWRAARAAGEARRASEEG